VGGGRFGLWVRRVTFLQYTMWWCRCEWVINGVRVIWWYLDGRV
jgi:hypothetical protein